MISGVYKRKVGDLEEESNAELDYNNKKRRRVTPTTTNSLLQKQQSQQQQHYYSPQVMNVLGSPAINLPIKENVVNPQDHEILEKIDKDFSLLPYLPKIFQKRITNKPDSYFLSYSWKFDPGFYLRHDDLINLRNNHLMIQDFLMNPSGGTCSKESNITLGIATPCYCDMCEYERSTSTSNEINVAAAGTNINENGIVVMGGVKRIIPAPGNLGRFIIKVKKSPSALV